MKNGGILFRGALDPKGQESSNELALNKPQDRASDPEGMRTPSPRIDEPGHSPRFPAGSSDVKIHKASRKHTASFLASQQFLQKKSSLKALGKVFKTKV
jgi:hypothetical protein